MTKVKELQTLLIERIKQIDNVNLLNEVLKVLEEVIYELNEWEKAALKKSDEDLANGRIYTNEEVFASTLTDKWLKEQDLRKFQNK